jgi:3-oxoacyl-[acyl-carrier-protein] synthase II
VTPLGTGIERCWSRLVQGERAIGPVRRFSVEGQRTALAAEVRDTPEVTLPGWSRTAAMAATAAEEAMHSARIDVRATRVGLVVGTTTGGMLETERLLARLHAEPGCRDALADMLSHPLSATGDRLHERLGPFARVRVLSSACSSGANAIVVGASWLLSGEVDAVVVGGTDGLCRLTLSGFNALAALDAEPCRPFDRRRAGTTLGEGAGFLVLERADHARLRGVAPVCELAGWASGSEAHHVTNPAADGDVVVGLVRRALDRAGLSPSDLDYINAHGTGTRANDLAELSALARALGPAAAHVSVSSSKGQIGHCLGAAGAIEAVITALVVQRRTLVPTAGLEQPEGDAPFVHVPGRGRTVDRVRAALSCSFGFGGMDAVLAFAEAGRTSRRTDPPRRDVFVTGTAIATATTGVVSGEGCGSLATRDATSTTLDTDAELDPTRGRRLDHVASLGVVAAQAALKDAGGSDPSAGLVFGSAFGNVDGSAAFMHRIFDRGPRAASPAEFPNLVPSAPVGHASIYLGLRGPALAASDLGTSAEAAFAQAVQLVASGEADRVVAGAVETRSAIVEHVLSAIFARGGAAGRGHADVASAVVVDAGGAGKRGARVVQVTEWRGDPTEAFAALAGPRGTRAEVVVARPDARIDGWLGRTAWLAASRTTCPPAFAGSDGRGGIALAMAAARITSRAATDVLVVGLDEDRGALVVLSAP